MTVHAALRGRAPVVAEVVDLLQAGGPRVITLTGLPGVGKTRLARHVASQPQVVRVAAVAVVGPAGTRAADQLELEIASAAGLTIPSAQDRAAVRAAIDAVPRLVLIDVLDGAAATAGVLAELLDRFERIRFLVTSRSPLHVPDERVVRVEPLDGESAVQLFLDVAAATGARAPTGAALADVAFICSELGGLPQAIELAAARSTAFSPTAMRRLLERTSPLDVFAPPDQRRPANDLLGTIEWSDSVLEVRQQQLLQDLTVFRSPVPVEAIEAVCHRDDLDELVNDLSVLVDAHLVEVDHGIETSRYWLHPLIHGHAARRLAAVGVNRRADLEARHTAWASSLATRAVAPGPEGAGAVVRAVSLVERDVLAALERALEAGDAPSAAHLALGMVPVWLDRGASATHVELLDRTLGAVEGSPDEATVRAGVALLAAERVARPEDVEVVVAHIDRAVALARDGPPATLLRVLRDVAHAALAVDRRDRLEPLLDEGLALAIDEGDEPVRGQLEVWMGMLAHQQERIADARAHGVAALERARVLGDPSLLVSAAGLLRSLPAAAVAGITVPSGRDLVDAAQRAGEHRALAWLQPLAATEALRAGELADAAGACADLLTMARDAAAWRWCEVPTMCLVGVATVRGDLEVGARLHGSVAVHLSDLRSTLPPWGARAYEGTLVRLRRRLGEETFDRAARSGSTLTYREAAEEALAYARQVRDDGRAAEEVVPVSSPGHLTRREAEVLERLVAGDSNKDIAARLGITAKTAMHHTSSIYRKLQVRGRTEAVAWAVRHGQSM